MQATATATKQTNIAQRRDHLRSVQDRVRPLVGYSEQGYCNNIFYTGLRYLEILVPDDAEARKIISEHRLYWNWWKNQWANRDEDFIMEMEDHRSQATRRAHYHSLHDAQALVDEVTPHGKLLGTSYSLMIRELYRAVMADK